MEFVLQALGRRFATGMGIRRVIKSMFHVVVNTDELFAASSDTLVTRAAQVGEQTT